LGRRIFGRYNGGMAHKPSSARAAKNLDALAPVAGDVVAHRGLPTKDLRPLELHALAKAGKAAEKVRDALRPGLSQRVDFTVRVHGTIDVANAQTAQVTDKPDLGEVLAVVLGTLPPKMRTEAVEEAIKRLKHPRPEIELSHEWLGFVEAIVGQLSVQKTQQKRGNVTGTLMTEVLIRGS
jgi:hypothetical protein